VATIDKRCSPAETRSALTTCRPCFFALVELISSHCSCLEAKNRYQLCRFDDIALITVLFFEKEEKTLKSRVKAPSTNWN
jgi:hypothetical protein